MSADRDERNKPGRRRLLYVVWGAIALTCLAIVSLFFTPGSTHGDLFRNALWEVVHNVCVPGQLRDQDPRPCLRVELGAGVDSGFAILRDPRSPTHFLLIPTARIPGIESPLVIRPDATNYFAKAWEFRTSIAEALHRPLPSDQIGLAINSAVGRSQDQLHIHMDCLRPDVFAALHENQAEIGNHWAAFKHTLAGQHYSAIWIEDDSLTLPNPFRILEEQMPGAARTMGSYTLVITPLQKLDKKNGFVLLADKADATEGDLADGEELLDHDCRLAATANSADSGVPNPANPLPGKP